MYNKEDKRRYLILQCRYYKGEEQPPEQENELFWDYERHWVESALEEGKDIDFLMKEAQHFHLETKNGDTTPLTLKALLWNRYYHWTCGLVSVEEELKSFEQWYIGNYQICKTNREQRAEKRRPELIAQCRFYRGEETCPYEKGAPYFSWECEKEWVESLSMSWLARDRYIDAFQNLPSFGAKDVLILNSWKNRAKEMKVPFTLLCCLASKYADGFCGFKHEIEENFEFFIKEEYLKEL